MPMSSVRPPLGRPLARSGRRARPPSPAPSAPRGRRGRGRRAARRTAPSPCRRRTCRACPRCSNTTVDHPREVLVQLRDDVLGLPLLGEGREAADVGEEHRHLAPRAAEPRARRVGHQLVVDVLRRRSARTAASPAASRGPRRSTGRPCRRRWQTPRPARLGDRASRRPRLKTQTRRPADAPGQRRPAPARRSARPAANTPAIPTASAHTSRIARPHAALERPQRTLREQVVDDVRVHLRAGHACLRRTASRRGRSGPPRSCR